MASGVATWRCPSAEASRLVPLARTPRGNDLAQLVCFGGISGPSLRLSSCSADRNQPCRSAAVPAVYESGGRGRGRRVDGGEMRIVSNKIEPLTAPSALRRPIRASPRGASHSAGFQVYQVPTMSGHVSTSSAATVFAIIEKSNPLNLTCIRGKRSVIIRRQGRLRSRLFPVSRVVSLVPISIRRRRPRRNIQHLSLPG
jgi:hypothetical protein